MNQCQLFCLNFPISIKKIPATSFAELAIIASSLLFRRYFISVLFDT